MSAPMTGIHPRKGFRPLGFKGKPTPPPVCPHCGQEAEAHKGADTPWRCTDARCPFHLGYRIEVWPVKPDDNLPDTLVAVPRDAKGKRIEELAAGFPRRG